MTKFCPNCGNPIDEGALFCDSCGMRIDAQSNDHPEPSPDQIYGDQYTQPPQQTPAQSYGDSYTQYPQQTQQYIPYGQPVQQQGQSYPQYGSQQPPEKKKTGLYIALGIAGVVVIAAVVVFVLVILPKLQSSDNTKPTATASVTEKVTEQATEAATEPVTEEPTEEPTEPPTEAPTEAPTEPKADLPYVNSLGKINDYDFAWISDAMSGSLTGEFLSNDELLGKWKGEFIFDGIWELVYVTIESDGTVTVEPYQINYGDGWENESGDAPYSFSGSFDINRVYGSGKYGKIDLYQFLQSDGTHYGVGKLEANTGYAAKVYLVRP